MYPSVNANCRALENDDGYIAVCRKSHSLPDSSEPDSISVVVETYVDGVSTNKFVDNCLYYIAGFIIRYLSKVLSCEECVLALHEKILDSPDPAASKLFCRKDRGGLLFPSGSVFRIISTTENILSREIICISKLPNTSHLALQIQCTVLDKLSSHSLFPMFGKHFRDDVFLSGESHYLQLLKFIIQKYVNFV